MKTPRFSLLKPLAITTLATAAINANSQALEEVVITAQKRAQDLQDVPIAVTAMSASMLKEAGISDVKGIALRTPNFSMGEFNPTQPQLYIRGIGSNGDGAGGGEQSVAMFIDGVYIPRSAGTGTELYDIESIEVLRGPQGTLWGKNAIAGAVNIRTSKPSDELTMGVEAEAGNMGLVSFKGMASGPISDQLNGKLGFNHKQRDPYVQSVVDPSIKTGDIDSQGLRGQLLFMPTDMLDFLLSVDWGKDRRSGGAVSPDSNHGLVGMFIQSPAAPRAGFYQNYLEREGKAEIDSSGMSLTTTWDMEFATLTAISAYRELESALENISFGVGLTTFPVLDLNNYTKEDSKMFSQELRLAGNTDQMNWQTGLYYNREKTNRTEGGEFATKINLNTFFAQGKITLLPSAIALPDDVTTQSNTTTSWAVFGQADYSLTANLDLTFGLRYTNEEKDYQNIGVRGAGLYVLENYNISANKSWSATTFKFVANYHINNNTMAYFSAATGFKSGGFDGVASTEKGAKTPFDQEEALNLELGLKTMLFDERLRLNTAVFNMAYDDLQILQAFPNGGPIPPLQTKNAGEAESKGLELETQWAINDEFTLSATYAYLSTKYTKLDGSLASNIGNHLRNAPKNTYSLLLDYRKALGSGGEVSARAEYITKDIAYQDIENYSYAAIDEYSVGNLRAAYSTSDENWEIALWVKNITDEEYYIHNYQISPFGAFHIAALPRNYGVTVSWKNW